MTGRSTLSYGWRTADEWKIFHESLVRLQLHPLAIWPPPKQLEWMGKKSPDAIILGIIANRLGNLHPHTVVLDVRKMEGNSIPKNTVLKRSNSDCGHHVIFPNDRRKRMLSNLQENSVDGETWISQEFVPTLQTVGDWRVFVVNGRILHVVHTYKSEENGAWVGNEAISFWSLEEIR